MKRIRIFLLVALLLLVLLCTTACQPKDSLVAQWIVNGEDTQGWPEQMILHDNGTATIDGGWCNWSDMDHQLQLMTLFNKETFSYTFYDHLLILEDKYGDRRVYTNPQLKPSKNFKPQECDTKWLSSVMDKNVDPESIQILSREGSNDHQTILTRATAKHACGEIEYMYKFDMSYDYMYYLWLGDVEMLSSMVQMNDSVIPGLWNYDAFWGSAEGQLTIHSFDSASGHISYSFILKTSANGSTSFQKEGVGIMAYDHEKQCYILTLGADHTLKISPSGVAYNGGWMEKVI